MIATIILANVAAGFAFLFGATYDWSALIPRSQRLNKVAAFTMTVALALLTMMVARSAN